MKPYPTKQTAASGRKSRSGSASRATIAARRVDPPEIFIKCQDREHPWRDPYARAHLRNRKGYVYLSWRDGQRVREFYIGKAPRKSPTRELDVDPDRAPAPASCRRSLRRGKK